MTMTDYRKRAEECVEIAQTARTPPNAPCFCTLRKLDESRHGCGSQFVASAAHRARPA
jgi:hypothetical protein